MKANNLDLGDSIAAIINGRRKELRIVGVAFSPEYVFQIKPGDMLPDPKHFGILWMEHEALADRLSTCTAGSTTCRSACSAMRRPRRSFIESICLLEPYGGLGAFARKDQLSHLLLESDIQSLQTVGLIAPTIFLCVAAFLLNVVLTRLTSLQREQIAALKAFGYTNLQIAWHYMKFVLLITMVGGCVGTFGGMWLAHDFTKMFLRVYQYPELIFRVRPNVVAKGDADRRRCGAPGRVRRDCAGRALAAGRGDAAGAAGPLSADAARTDRLRSAGAERRPDGAAATRAPSGEDVVLAPRDLDVGGDHRRRQLHAQLGRRSDSNAVSSTCSDTICRWRRSSRSRSTRSTNWQICPASKKCEPRRSVAARLRAENHSRRVGIIGLPHELPADAADQQDRPIREFAARRAGDLEEAGPSAARAAGQTVRVEALQDKRPVADVPVVELLDDIAGLNAYMDIDALNRLMREGPRVSGAMMTTDPLFRPAIYRHLKETPQVASVTIRQASVDSFRNTVAKNMMHMRMINLLFAIIIALGVVYNGARISLSERSRELATLRVIGFTRREISTILLGEIGTITLLGIPFGFVMGYWFARGLTYFLDQEVFRFPFVISNSTYGLAAGAVLAASIGSALLVRRAGRSRPDRRTEVANRVRELSGP